ncbi:putative MAGE domain-containing protein MAGEA13P [Meriones unguiculatus]|uniref:putative MAGE domain-containing protein MAGEA13P n=1 Tax=Meriones unguiculatus TaxID=10047 RepID=UPI000B4F0120|nr:putative MAGE domain-containing protein MAGEA13P [Meriones unguiculatus]
MSHMQKHEQGLEGQLGKEVLAAMEMCTTEEVFAAGDSQETCSSFASIQAIPSSKAIEEGSGDHGEGDQSTSKAYLYSKVLLSSALQKKVNELVKFLSFKYTINEPVTEAEILKSVVKPYDDYYMMIFKHACECMEVFYGIEVKEVDAFNHSYMLLKMLDLTYDGKLSNDEGIPKMGLLMLTLGVIFMEGNRATEKKILEVLNTVGVYPDQHEFICRDPRKFVTEELVLENYLVYQLVPHSDPPSYEFLWGPRANAETSKMKALQFFSQVAGSSPTSFTALYKEALQDEVENAQALLASVTNINVPDKYSSGKKSSSVSHPE